MKHVVITGGAGFIGSHLCDSFLRKGFAVTAIDNLVTGDLNNLREASQNENFQLIEADISRPLEPILAQMQIAELHGIEGVLHFACPASPVDFDRIPFTILEVDSLGTMNTVELALRYNSRYLLASTSEIYGDPLVHPQVESYFGNVNTVGPRACYDEAKRFAEAYVTTAQRHRGLNAGIVRIFNTYGPRMRPDDGRVIPEFCMEALKGNRGLLPICGDGLQTRSLCFVSDLVRGILSLYESDHSLAVNLGNPDERSVLEIARLLIELAGGSAGIRYLPARPDDPRRRCPDITRARELLGWYPQVSVRDGLKTVLDYFRTRTHAAKIVEYEMETPVLRSGAV